MKRIESSVKRIDYSQESVYSKLSDLSNLEELLDRIPKDDSKMPKDLECTTDTVSCTVPPVGKVEIAVVSREPHKCIKLETTSSPVKLTLWIQLVGLSESTCKMKLTADIDVNAFMAKMVEKPMSEAREKLAETLPSIPY